MHWLLDRQLEVGEGPENVLLNEDLVNDVHLNEGLESVLNMEAKNVHLVVVPVPVVIRRKGLPVDVLDINKLF